VKRPLHIIVLIAFAAILTQGFQCASSGVSSAKKAIQQRDFQKAKTSLATALAENPNNCEALMLLGDVHAGLNEIDSMAMAYERATDCPEIGDKMRDELSIKMYNAWAAAYNSGVTGYNGYIATKADSDIVQAEFGLRTAIRLKPAQTAPYNLLGMVLELREDTAGAYAVYEQWWNQERPGIELLLSKEIVLGSTHESIIAALGSPKETKVDSIMDGDQYQGVTIKDRFDVGGRELYVFSTQEIGKADTVLEGWRYNPSPKISSAEKWFPTMFTMSPLKSLAYIDYQEGRKEKALQYATTAISFNPKDNDLVPLRTQLLQDLGKTEEALSEIKATVQRDPNNIQYRLQYAVLLANVGRREEATAQYKEVLSRDPKNGPALFNLAANYKNIAGEKQMAELKKMDANEKYQPNLSYLEDLKVAAGYFEELRTQPKYASDLVVLEQLANTYEVLKEKGKVRALIMELEGLEAKYKDNPEYFRIMEGLYGRSNMIEKMKEASEKGSRLRGSSRLDTEIQGGTTATGSQCLGTTQKGQRCKNTTTNGSGFCHLHADQAK
jgi:Flp pilus assembly protein TadD